MLTFGGTSEKCELFEDLFQASLRIHNQQTKENRIKYFHYLLKGDTLQNFNNISSPDRKNVREIVAVFGGKCVKPQSRAKAKQNLVFNPTAPKVI